MSDFLGYTILGLAIYGAITLIFDIAKAMKLHKKWMRGGKPYGLQRS